jgi:hypothetical protein
MLLPRAVVVRIGAMLAERMRRSDLKRLPAARENFDRAYAADWRTGVVTPDARELLFLATWSSGATYALSRARELGRPMGVARYDQLGAEAPLGWAVQGQVRRGACGFVARRKLNRQSCGVFVLVRHGQ